VHVLKNSKVEVVGLEPTQQRTLPVSTIFERVALPAT